MQIGITSTNGPSAVGLPDPLDPDLDEPYGKRPSTEVTRFRSRPSVDKGVIISYIHASLQTGASFYLRGGGFEWNHDDDP